MGFELAEKTNVPARRYHSESNTMFSPGSPYTPLGQVMTPYDEGVSVADQKYLPLIRSNRQSDWTALGNSIFQALGTVAGQGLDSVGAIMDLPRTIYHGFADKFTKDDFTNPISEWGRDLQTFVQNLAPIYADPERSFGHAAWWLQNAPSVASSLSMLIPMEGAAAAAGGLARFLRMGKLGSQMLQVGVGALTGRIAENYMEAGNLHKEIYTDARNRGKSEEEAQKLAGAGASTDYVMNYLNLAFDVIQMGAILKPLKTVSSLAGASKIKQVAELGFESAEKRALGMTTKGIMYGTKWYDKVAMNTLRFGSPLTAQLGEGVEEAINEMSTKEGKRKARLMEGTATDDDQNLDFMQRLSNYVVDKDVAQSAFWGIFGGIAFHHVGLAINKSQNILRGREASLHGSVKAAALSERSELINKYVNVANDDEATPIEKLKTKHNNLWELTKSAINSDTLDLLLSDMDDKTYQTIIAKKAGIDEATAVKNIAELKKDIEYIARAHDTYAGNTLTGWKNFNQEVNTSPFGDDDITKEFVKRGAFQFLQSEMADHLTFLDYAAHKSDETTLQAHHEIKQLVDKADNTNPHYRTVLDNHMRNITTDGYISDLKEELKMMEDAGISDASMDITRDQIKNLEAEKIRLRNNALSLKQIIDMDNKDANGTPLGYDQLLEKVKKETLAPEGFEDRDHPIAVNYKSIVDDQMTKMRYARERALVIQKPSKYYKEFLESRARMQIFAMQRDLENKRYGFTKSDTPEDKELKRRKVDSMDEDIKEDDKRYRKEDREKYKAWYKEANEEYSKDYHKEDIAQQLSGYKEKLKEVNAAKTADFDFDAYIKASAYVDALTHIIDSRKKPETPQTAAGSTPVDLTSKSMTAGMSAQESMELMMNNFDAGAEALLKSLQVLYTPMSDKGIAGGIDSATILDARRAGTLDTEDMKKTLKYSNQIFLDHYKTVYHPAVMKIMGEVFRDKYGGSVLEVLDKTTDFLNDLRGAFDQYRKDNNITKAAEAVLVIEDPSQVDPVTDILYDEFPEPDNSGKSATDIYPKDNYLETRTDNDINTNEPILEGEKTNEGYVALSHGTYLQKWDGGTKKFVYNADGSPKLNPDFAGYASNFHLSLLDPESANHLKAGDRIEIHGKHVKDGVLYLELYKVVEGSNELVPMGNINSTAANTTTEQKKYADAIRELAKKHGGVLHAHIASHNIKWGRLLTPKTVNGEKGAKPIPVKLSVAVPLTEINKPGGMYLGVHNGKFITIRNNNGDLEEITATIPNSYIASPNKFLEHSGQTMAVIPTNDIPRGRSKGKGPEMNEHRTYVTQVVRTADNGQRKNSKGENIAVAVLKKLMDPYHNQAFIRSLSGIIPSIYFDPAKGLEEQLEEMNRLYTRDNITIIMNRMLFSKARRDDDKQVKGNDYKYPFYVDIKNSNQIARHNNKDGLTRSIKVTFGRDLKEMFFEIGTNNPANQESYDSALKAIDTFTNDKPMRIDSAEIGKTYGSNVYRTFTIEGGDVVVKEYPNGYLQYIDENNVLNVTFASMAYEYEEGGQRHSARTFFGEPVVHIDMENITEGKVAKGTGDVKRLSGDRPGEYTFPDNTQADIDRFLSESRSLTKFADYYERSVTEVVKERYDRTSNVLFGKPDEALINKISGIHGGTVDKMFRDYFANDGKLTRPANISEEHFNKVLNALHALKAEFAANGETVYADNRTVYDRFNKSAGEMDLVTIDKDRALRIYDMKSFASTLADAVKDPNKIPKWTKQQNAYANMLKNEFGLEVKGLYIIPVELTYGRADDNINAVVVHPRIALARMEKVESEVSDREISVRREEPPKTGEDIASRRKRSLLVSDTPLRNSSFGPIHRDKMGVLKGTYYNEKGDPMMVTSDVHDGISSKGIDKEQEAIAIAEIKDKINKLYDAEQIRTNVVKEVAAATGKPSVRMAGQYRMEIAADGKTKLYRNRTNEYLGEFDDKTAALTHANTLVAKGKGLLGGEGPEAAASVSGVLSEIYDAENINSKIQDPTMPQVVRDRLIEMTNTAIIDVLYRETLGKGTAKMDVQKDLMPMVRQELINDRDKYVTKAREKMAEATALYDQEGEDHQFEIDLLNHEEDTISGYIDYYNTVLDRFDNDAFPQEVRDKAGEFIGYFKVAFFFVSGSKLIKNVGAEENIFDFTEDPESGGLTMRHNDSFYATINPKDTVSFQTKVFLSRIPKRINNNNVQLTEAGAIDYHDLNHVLRVLWKTVNDLTHDNFMNDLAELAPFHPILRDLIAALQDLDEDAGNNKFGKWSFTRDQLERKISTSTLMKNTTNNLVKLEYDEASDTTYTTIMDANRQKVDDQIRDEWENNFKNQRPKLFNIEKEIVENVPVFKVKSLKAREHGTYTSPGGNKMTLRIPTWGEIETIANGQVYDSLNDARYHIFQQLQDIVTEASKKENEGKTFDIVIPELTREQYKILQDGEERSELGRDAFVKMLNYVSLPSNVRISEGDAARINKLEIGSIFDAISSELDIGNGNEYSRSSLKLIASQMSRIGFEMADDPKNSWALLNNLQQGRGVKRYYEYIDPKAASFRDFLQDKILRPIHMLTATRNVSEQSSSEEKTEEKIQFHEIQKPFNDINLSLKDLAKASRLGWPKLFSPNIVNMANDNEFTLTPHNYISNRFNMILHDKKVRDDILKSVFSRRSQIIKSLFLDTKSLESLSISEYKGVKVGNVPTTNKKMNDVKQIAVDYGIFQNSENADNNSRGKGYFITSHGESKTSPMISVQKQHIDYDFIETKNDKGEDIIEIRLKTKDSPFYNMLFEQFRSNLDRVLHTERVMDIIREHEQKHDLVSALAFARANYKEGYHFITDGKTIKPGSGHKFHLFGNHMFYDHRNVIYKDGRLHDNLRKLLNKDEDLEGVAYAHEAFQAYANQFLNDALNKHVEHMDSYGETFFKTKMISISKKDQRFLGGHFPMFDNDYIQAMNKRLVQGTNPPSVGRMVDGVLTWSRLRPDYLHTYREGGAYGSQDEVDKLNEGKDKGTFPEFHKRYIMADYVFNHLLFKNTYFQLTEDPADFLKSENFEQMQEEMNKRLKHHLGPGNVKMKNGRDQLRVIYFNDVTPGQQKVSVPISQVLDGQVHNRELLHFMDTYRNKEGIRTLAEYVDIDKTHYHLPSNWKSLGAVFAIHQGDNTPQERHELAKILKANLDQKMTDGGSLMTTREIVSRMVQNGDVSRERAGELHRALEEKNIDSKKMKSIQDRFGIKSLLVNKYIYSGNRTTQYKEGITAAGGDRMATLQDFHVKKDSEVALTNSATKNTQWDPIMAHLEELEDEDLRARGIKDRYAPEAYDGGIVLVPVSAMKSRYGTAIDLFNNKGLYTQVLKTAPIDTLDRVNLREQLSKGLKEKASIISSSQLRPNSQMDVASNVDFTRVNNSGIPYSGSLTNVQMNNARYRLEDQVMNRDMKSDYARRGIRLEEDMGVRIVDIKKMINTMRQQLINQNGVGIILEAFHVKDNELSQPLSFTPHGYTSQNVMLNEMSKNVSGRMAPGRTVIQMTSIGFNKSSIDVTPNLEGFTIEVVPHNRTYMSEEVAIASHTKDEIARKDGKPWIVAEEVDGVWRWRPMVHVIKPAEIEISWNFTDKKGKLLPYEKYVNEDGTPKLDMIDPELLKMISYRVPNTPHNTVAPTKVVRFISPLHRDIVRVPPQIMTNMSSDNDVDVLNFYYYNYEITPEGKMRKIKGVLHQNQADHTSLTDTEINLANTRERKLREVFDYTTKLGEKKAIQKTYYDAESRLMSLVREGKEVPIAELLEDPEMRQRYIDTVNTYNQIAARIGDNEVTQATVIDLYDSAVKDPSSVPFIFKDLYEQNYSEYTMDDAIDSTDTEAVSNVAIQKTLDMVRLEIKNMDRSKIDEVINVLKTNEKSKYKIKEYQEEARSAIERKGEGVLADINAELRKMEEEFDKTYDKSKLSIYDKQTKEQLENAMLDSFMMIYTNADVFRRMTTPLSTDLLKGKAEDENLQFINKDTGEVDSTSILEGIYKKGFSSINDYQSQLDFRTGSNENADMVAVFASNQRGIQIFQNISAFLTKDDQMLMPPMYGEVDQKSVGKRKTLMRDGKVVIKRDSGTLGSDHSYTDDPSNLIYRSGSETSIYRNSNSGYAVGGKMPHHRTPNDDARFRLDSIWHRNNYGRKVSVSQMIEAALQGVLDGIKDPLAPKIRLNMKNVDVFIGHAYLGYSDEIVPLLWQEIVQDYEKNIKQDKLKGEGSTSAEKKAFIRKYLKLAGIDSKELLDKMRDSKVSPLQAMEMAMGDRNLVLSEVDLNDMLVRNNNLDQRGTEKDKEYYLGQLAAFHNYLKTERIGSQITTALIALNTYSKGFPATILEADEKKDQFFALHNVTLKGEKGATETKITSSVPNIGNIQNVSTLLQRHQGYSKQVRRYSAYDLPVRNGLVPVTNMISNMGSTLFTELSPVFKEMYNSYDEILNANRDYKRSTAAHRQRLAVSMTSFFWSNPELYHGMFENDEEFEVFKKNMRRFMLNQEKTKDGMKDIANPSVFAFDKSLAEEAKRLSEKLVDNGDGTSSSYGQRYRLLNAFKYITGDSRIEQPEYILYMNMADLKGSFENDFAMSIPRMLEDKNPEIKALAKQLILYAHLNGAITTPNSYIKHIPQSIRNKFDISRKLREMLRYINSTEMEVNEKGLMDLAGMMRMQVVKTFLLQYFQHHPYEAPVFPYDYLQDSPNGEKGNKWYREIVPDVKANDSNKLIGANIAKLSDRNAMLYTQGFVFQVMGNDGKMKLAVYTLIDDIPHLQEIDKAGNTRRSSTEYHWNTDIDPIETEVFGNMSGSAKKDIIIGRREEIRKQDEQRSTVQEYKEGLEKVEDVGNFGEIIIDFSVNPAHRALALALKKSTSFIPLRTQNDLKVKGQEGKIKGGYFDRKIVGGYFDPKIHEVVMDPKVFFDLEGGDNNIDGLEKTFLHEQIHAALYRAIQTILSSDNMSNGQEIFSKLVRQEVERTVTGIRKSFGVLQAIMENKQLAGHDVINNAIKAYEKNKKDLKYTEKHSYVVPLLMLKEMTKKGQSVINPNTRDATEMNAVNAVINEFVAEFMTNATFQEMLNDVIINNEFRDKFKEVAKGKTLLETILNWIKDLIDALQGLRTAKDINTQGVLATTITEGSLAHMAAGNILSLIKHTKEPYVMFNMAEMARKSEAAKKPAGKKPPPVNVWFSSGDNAILSNLSPRPFTYEEHEYMSVEHAYQTLKSGNFDDSVYRRWKPTTTKITGSQKPKTEGGFNLDLMKKLIKQSFISNSSDLSALLATGEADITHREADPFWAKAFPKILMEVRKELRDDSGIDDEMPFSIVGYSFSEDEINETDAYNKCQ